MEAIIFTGLQAAGKSSFYKERFFATHLRINLDMLKTRHRERTLLTTCITLGLPFVVDNTNPTPAERSVYIVAARAAGFRVVGYYFRSQVAESIQRNATRGAAQVPEVAIKGTSRRLQLPSIAEGFDALFYVKITPEGFQVEAWNDAV